MTTTKNYIFSFSLFGEDIYYLKCLINQINQIRKYYTKKNTYFYITVEKKYLFKKELKKLKKIFNTKIFYKNINEQKYIASFWRYLINNKKNSYFIFRDADCYFFYRDYKIIQQWINSKLDFCSVRDSPTMRWPIMAGMFFSNSSGLKKIKTIYRDSISKIREYGNIYYLDQLILRDFVYPQIANKTLVISENVRYLNDSYVEKPVVKRKFNYGFSKDVMGIPPRYSLFGNNKRKSFLREKNNFFYRSKIYNMFKHPNLILCTYHGYKNIKFLYYLFFFVIFIILNRIFRIRNFGGPPFIKKNIFFK